MTHLQASGHRHEYRTSARWTGSTGSGYDLYERAHEISVPPSGVTLAVSADPAFRGDPALLNPEQLVVAAASSCQLLSFLAVAARARIDIRSYHDQAFGVMPEGSETSLTEIRLRPRIGVATAVSDDRLTHLVEAAHRACFVARSLRATIVVEPSFEHVVR